MADTTTQAFVCGHPIRHSRSPLLHNYWLNRYGIPGTYRAIDVAPGNVSYFLQTLQRNGFAGGNITVPHKEVAYRSVHSLDPAAGAIRAVNTVWFENGKLIGGNTDAYGFARNLTVFAPGWSNGETALVIGAGGASRAIVYALLNARYRRIHILNRTLKRAEEVASSYGDGVLPGPIENVARVLPVADLVVNTTTLGMEDEGEFAFTLDNAREDAIATDAVYVPLRTPFLRMAEARGMRTVDGLGMLLYQAVPGFARWFGIEPMVDDTVRQLIVSDLEKHS
jgi:shikimate dehydrogenase